MTLLWTENFFFNFFCFSNERLKPFWIFFLLSGPIFKVQDPPEVVQIWSGWKKEIFTLWLKKNFLEISFKNLFSQKFKKIFKLSVLKKKKKQTFNNYSDSECYIYIFYQYFLWLKTWKLENYEEKRNEWKSNKKVLYLQKFLIGVSE